jgi:2-polyprenyl-3-methyl-5-hydroxy-6-metoxy-1,4-benzoquinol methylase
VTKRCSSFRLLPLERVACCCCGGWDGHAWRSGHDVEFKTCANLFTFIRCVRCGHIYLSERPRPEDIPIIYERYLTLNRCSAYYPSKSVSWVKDHVFDRYRMRHVLRHLHENSNVLDIGAGAGRLLKLLRRISRTKLQLYANDYAFDSVTRAELEADGIRVLEGPIEACVTDCRYDAMTAIHVLEHVSYPVQTFEWITRHLRPSGVVYIETPDADALMSKVFRSRWGMLHFPRHFNLFTKAKLAQLATRSGLRIIRHGNTTGAPAWNMSIRNVLGRDALTCGQSWLDIFNYSNVITLGAFTLVDLMLLSAGVITSTQQMVAIK